MAAKLKKKAPRIDSTPFDDELELAAQKWRTLKAMADLYKQVNYLEARVTALVNNSPVLRENRQADKAIPHPFGERR
jgi:hypothetical protein